ncbi:hypothetical protein OQA88_2406 [Cercophora sp. LCS_1]
MQRITQDANKIHSGASDGSHALFDGDVFKEFRVRTREALAPGTGLDDQNLRMAKQSVTELDSILKANCNIELLSWTKHIILQGVSAGLYGMQHPFVEPEMEKAMWDWDKHRPTMHMKLDVFGQGAKARAMVVEALRRYFGQIPEDASPVVLERRKVLQDAGIDAEDALKMQAFLNDGNFNIVPMLYWALYDIYSRPGLLEAIRKEVADNAVHKSTTEGDKIFTLDVSAIKTRCPLLLGAYQETQRTRHMLPNTRFVLEDTLLDGRYLLKKGRLLYLPTWPIHHDEKIWGPRTSEYDPRRFMPGEPGVSPLPSSFLPWGTAPYICPARQFVSTGILVMMALMVSRVDLEPAQGRIWDNEPKTQWLEIATLPTAREDMNLTVMPRDEGMGKWTVISGTPKTAVPLKSR